jgi:hypothetical protein
MRISNETPPDILSQQMVGSSTSASIEVDLESQYTNTKNNHNVEENGETTEQRGENSEQQEAIIDFFGENTEQNTGQSCADHVNENIGTFIQIMNNHPLCPFPPGPDKIPQYGGKSKRLSAMAGEIMYRLFGNNNLHDQEDLTPEKLIKELLFHHKDIKEFEAEKDIQ